MDINLLFEGVDSKYGYQSALLKQVDKYVKFNRCIMTVKKHDDMDCFNDKYVEINYDVCEQNRYEDICDFNDLEPLSREILEKMAPYESTAMKMLVRNMEVDVYTYEEAKRLYLQHLRFWHDIFMKYKINFVVMNCTPHHTHDYIIYALAKIKNIGMSVNVVTNIKNWWFTNQDIVGVGTKVSEEYYKHKNDKDDIILPEQIEKYYQSLIYQEKGKKDNTVYGGKTAKQMTKTQNETFWSFAGHKNALIRNAKRLKSSVRRSIEDRSMKAFQKAFVRTKQDLYFMKRIRIRMKVMKTIDYFNSLAEFPDYNEKYIVYYLHYQPEGTTLPQAGVFVEQEVVLQILAKSLEGTGIKLYVKEHFVQLYRNKTFYDDIAAIRNCKLIKSSVDSKELMMHSIATSACNGTIILESIVNGKPSIVFSLGGFSDGPGIFPAGTAEECHDIIQKILTGETDFDQNQVRRYFKAFADLAVFSETFWNRCEMDEEKFNRSKESNANRIISAINDYRKWGKQDEKNFSSHSG